MTHEFVPFGKIGRLNRECIITEKLDGTNAQIHILDDGETLLAASRNRYITPGKDTDNHGFATWAYANKTELLKLGPGRHFGEWWGYGISKRYNGIVPQGFRTFSLFNVERWSLENMPDCCAVVPVLYRGMFDTRIINQKVEWLRENGSVAVPGAPSEGVVVYQMGARQLFKVTCEHDERAKGEV